MYEYLRGRVEEIGARHVVLETGDGVGWSLQVPGSLTARLRRGEEARILVHLSISDTARTLYGFATPLERRLFRKLIQVSGIGPATALSVLSALPAEALIRTILDGEVDRLVTLRGIGRKTAERIVVELRDGLRDLASELGTEAAAGASPEEDLVRVLTDLGMPAAAAGRAAERARSRLGPDADFQDLLKAALRDDSR